MPSSTTRLRVVSERAVATMVRAAPYSRAARAIELPISPTPISASLSMMCVDAVTLTLHVLGAFPPPAKRRGGLGWGERGWAAGELHARPRTPDPSPPREACAGGGEQSGARCSSPLLPHEFGERLDGQPVGFLGADAHAQRVRQMIGADRAQHTASRGEQRVGLLRGLPLRLGKVDQDEIADTRRDLEAKLADLLRQPTEPFLVVLA